MNLIAVLFTGLFAGGVSCAAVQGGLLAGLLARMQVRQAVELVHAAPGRHGGVAVDGESAGQGPRSAEAEPRQPLAQFADDLVPVGAFLAGKVVSHAALGALLGALGAIAQPSIGFRTGLQLMAGLLIVVFGLAQLGVPGFRGIVIEPPRSWMRIVRNRARSQSALAPGLLGLASVLLPCGVTLSVQALA